MSGVRCLGCGALVPDREGPVHPYMLSAAGCWEAYCSLEDWKAGLVGEEAVGVVQDLVDSYGGQHATNPDRRNRQSVAVHLMSLCAGLERGLSGRERRARIGLWTGVNYPLLEPRPESYTITAPEVAAAPVGDRPSMVGEMAASTWAAWSAHHDTVRAWLEGR